MGAGGEKENCGFAPASVTNFSAQTQPLYATGTGSFYGAFDPEPPPCGQQPGVGLPVVRRPPLRFSAAVCPQAGIQDILRSDPSSPAAARWRQSARGREGTQRFEIRAAIR